MRTDVREHEPDFIFPLSTELRVEFVLDVGCGAAGAGREVDVDVLGEAGEDGREDAGGEGAGAVGLD